MSLADKLPQISYFTFITDKIQVRKMRKFEIEIVAVALAALVGVSLLPVGALADDTDVSSTRVQALEKELATIKRENELLRQIKAARAETSALSKGSPVASGRSPTGLGEEPAANRTRPIPATKPERPAEAYAADLSTKAPIYKAEPFADRSSWGGFYLGLGIGSRFTRAKASVTSVTFNTVTIPDAPGSMDMDHSSFRASPYLGYNWQVSPNWVLGVEGDWGWADRTTTLAGMAYPSLGLLTGAGGFGGFTPQSDRGDSFSLKSSWDASLRARVGYVVRPDILLYGTGGPAWLHVESTSTCTHGAAALPCAIGGAPLLTPLNITDSTTRLGWTLGGGIEAMLGSNWIARAEYRYASFGTISNIDNRTTTPFGDAIFGQVTASSVAYDLRLATQTVTFGVSYKFGSYGAVTARY